MQVPILSGNYTDTAGDFRTSYPRNLVPVPKHTGIAQGYLRPADGITHLANGPGVDRGGINWDGVCYRVMGSRLVSVTEAGEVVDRGSVGAGGQVSMVYSFDRLAIASGGTLYYYESNGAKLQAVTDVDIGTVLDVAWLGGYFIVTDGTSIVVTELNDPTAVNPLKYGSAESDPDPIKAIASINDELYAFGRYSIEAFRNVGGDFFPFQRIDGARVSKGIIGTHAYCAAAGTFAFLGSGRNEAPGCYLMAPGSCPKFSTREIDQILKTYTEKELSAVVMECRVDDGHERVMIHLPDRCLVYDVAASRALGEPVWYVLTSSVVGVKTYRARNLVWCYGTWIAGDPTSPSIGVLVSDVSSHYGQIVGWEFGTLVLYAEGRNAIVHELELVALTGNAEYGTDPTIWTSYSHDGLMWSMERAISVGARGRTAKRLAWRHQGRLRHWRTQKFRGTSESHLTLARLEIQLEPLNG